MFGIDLIDASLLPALLVALVAGMFSFLSPCVLPIVPPYLAYMAGTTTDEVRDSGPDRRVVTAALFFVLGLSTVFLLLGLVATSLGRALLQYQEWITMAAGAVIAIFGLHFLGILRIPLLYQEARMEAGDGSGSAVGAYTMGLAFAFGWSPCLGPILSMILSLTMQEQTLSRGAILMGGYALGLGLPFFLAAIFLHRFMKSAHRIKRHMGAIEKAMGGLLLIVGIAMATGQFTRFAFWLLETFPVLGMIG